MNDCLDIALISEFGGSSSESRVSAHLLAAGFRLHQVSSLVPSEALRNAPSLVLIELHSERADCSRYVSDALARWPGLPIITVAPRSVVSALSELPEGLEDIVSSDDLFRLGHAVRHTIERFQLRKGERDSQMRLRALIENANDVVTIIDLHGVAKFVSASASRVFGMDPDDLVGFSAFNRIHPDDIETAMFALAQLVSKGASDPIEFRYRCGDERYRWFEAVGTNLLHDPYVDGLVVTTRDIQARREAEVQRRQKEAWFSAAFTHAPIGMALVDLNGNWLHANQSLCDLAGYREADLLSTTLGELIPEVGQVSEGTIRCLVAGECRSTRTEQSLVRADGAHIWVTFAGTVLVSPDGEPEQLLLQILDINEQKLMQSRLLQEEEIFRTLMDHVPDVVYLKDRDGRFTRVNRAAARGYFGLEDPALAVGKTVFDLFPSEEAEYISATETRILEGDRAYVNQLERHEIDGLNRWNLTTKVPIRDANQEVLGLVGVSHDITELKQAEEKIRFQATLLEHVGAAVIVFDLESRITKWNRFAEQLFGWSEGESNGATIAELHLFSMEPSCETRVHDVLREGGTWEGEVECRTKHGTAIQARVAWSPVLDLNQGITGSVLIAQDVSDRARLEIELRKLALSDPLTGLPNRASIADRLSSMLKRAARRGEYVAVLFIDLDRFKVINDSLGHEAGDQVIVAVSERLAQSVRGGDVVGRFGGDEFTVLLEGLTNKDEATVVAERIISDLNGVFVVGGRQTYVNASIGIAVSDVRGSDPGELLRRADIALYRSKGEGRGRYSSFDDAMAVSANQRLDLETDLRRAVEREEFTLHYQPIVSLESGTVSAFEALLRWNHPVHGIISPAEFLSVMEDTGDTVTINRWILQRACADARTWSDEPGVGPEVFVNLSPRQFMEPNLVEIVQDVLTTTGLDTSQLRIEFTEQVLLDEGGQISRTIEGLLDLGVRLAIDDFGTGYSSLGYIRHLPISMLKIDRSFVLGLGSDSGSLAIIEAIAALAHTLGLEVTAEGIETTEQLGYVRGAGCNFGQGYLFAKPLPADQVKHFLNAFSEFSADLAIPAA